MLVLERVLVDNDASGGVLLLSPKDMAKKLGSKITTSGFVAARAGDVPDDRVPRVVEARLSVTYDWAPRLDKPEGALVVAAQASLTFVEHSEERPLQVALTMQDVVAHDKRADPSLNKRAQMHLERLVDRAIAAMADSLVARERLREAPHEELISALAIGLHEPTMRIWALQLAADRGLREAVPFAIKDMDAKSEKLRDAAFAALVELKDPTSVAALVRGINFGDYEKLRVAMEAVSAIGGEDAEEFLQFVATGHSDPDIVRTAKEHLAELTKRHATRASPRGAKSPTK